MSQTKDNSARSSGTSDSMIMTGLDTSSGRIGFDNKWDPLSSTLNVPLREGIQKNDARLLPLRIVVISDTHGFEGGLSTFSDERKPLSEGHHPSRLHNDDFLLPRADVLIHCGDFAASGSRKTQREASRRLDEFLARQTHIPDKVIVQGNHDPDSPSKVLFPNSKAIYIYDFRQL